MVVRQDLDTVPSLPPRLFMEQIMDNVSKVYCFLWDHKDKNNKLRLSWDVIRAKYGKAVTMSSLRKLCAEGLLEYIKSEDGVTIELVGWDEVVGAM